MNTPNDYKQVYKNLGTTPRTLGDAYRNADYATPIWRCETETSKGLRFLGDALLGLMCVVLPVLMVYAILTWLK